MCGEVIFWMSHILAATRHSPIVTTYSCLRTCHRPCPCRQDREAWDGYGSSFAEQALTTLRRSRVFLRPHLSGCVPSPPTSGRRHGRTRMVAWSASAGRSKRAGHGLPGTVNCQSGRSPQVPTIMKSGRWRTGAIQPSTSGALRLPASAHMRGVGLARNYSTGRGSAPDSNTAPNGFGSMCGQPTPNFTTTTAIRDSSFADSVRALRATRRRPSSRSRSPGSGLPRSPYSKRPQYLVGRMAWQGEHPRRSTVDGRTIG